IVTTVYNGVDCRPDLRKGTFYLILLDVSMLEMAGLEATAAIRSCEQGNGVHLPIVAMTADAMKGDEEQFLAARTDGYITKPIRSEELRDHRPLHAARAKGRVRLQSNPIEGLNPT